MTPSIDRRQLLQGLAAASAMAAWPARTALGLERAARFRIAACDWSLGLAGDPAALELGRKIGLQGIQVSFGAPGGKYDLRQEVVQRQFLDTAQEQGVAIASLGMAVLNSVPLGGDERAEAWVAECIDVMPRLKQKLVLLAFFGKGDMKNQPDRQEAVIACLRRLAPKAEKAGVILGLESWLNAEEHLQILEAVGSPAVQVYYDVANMEQQGYDLEADLRRLGQERICEIHCKENGALLGRGRVDFPKVKTVLDDLDWSGWLVIEGAVPPDHHVQEAYRKNREYLQQIFLPG